MDQDAFRETYRNFNERACLFEKSILINQCNCSKAKKFCIAEREGVQCLCNNSHHNCAEVLRELRNHAKFSLRTNNNNSVLPHGKAMQIQVGGLRGIKSLIESTPNNSEITLDVAEILYAALRLFGTFSSLPFSKIMPSIAGYKVKTRAKRRNQ
tara:strand:- start:35 stop:496 length:462 start_codon:yes stop_codon:yes gene_type:complete